MNETGRAFFCLMCLINNNKFEAILDLSLCRKICVIFRNQLCSASKQRSSTVRVLQNFLLCTPTFQSNISSAAESQNV